LYGLGTSHQPMDFQAMIDSQDFINDTWPMNASYEQVIHQAATFTPLTTQGFHGMQMQTLSHLNPHVPATPQPYSALSPQMALGGEPNFYGGGNATTSQPEEGPPQLPRHDDQRPNLDLEL